MACSFVSSSTINNGTRTNTTISAAAGIVDSDILRIFFRIADEPGPPPTPTPPTGFSQLLASTTQTGLGGLGTGEQKVWLWEKRASSESGAYIVTHAAGDSIAYMEVVRGAVASGSAEDFAATENAETNNSTYTATGGTTSITGSFVTIFIGAWNTINGTPPTGSTPTFTERYDTTEGYAANGIKIPAGATGDKSVSGNSQTATGGSISVLASVKAAAPTATITGTATATINETDIVSGGKTIIVTLANDTYVSGDIITPVIEAADCTNSGNNSADASWAVSNPDASTGDLLLFHIAWDDSTAVTSVTAPAGRNSESLTSIAGPVTDSGTETRAQLWYTKATATWTAGTIEFVPAAAEQWTAVCVRVPAGEFDSSTPIGNSGTRDSVSSASALSPLFSAGASDGNGRLIWFVGVDLDPLSATAGAGWTVINRQDIGAVAGGVATRDAEVTNSESITAAAAWKITDGDSWTSIACVVRAPATSAFDGTRQEIINGLDSAQSEGTGWNAEVRDKLAVTTVVRTSDTVCTITLSAEAAYNITAQETITATVPASAVAGMTAIVGTPTFTVDVVGGASSSAAFGLLLMGNLLGNLHARMSGNLQLLTDSR